MVNDIEIVNDSEPIAQDDLLSDDKTAVSLIAGFCRKCLGRIKRALRFVLYRFIRRTTTIVSNRIVFMSFSNEYACNPKYIAEALIRSGVDYELFWITSKTTDQFPWPNDIKID